MKSRKKRLLNRMVALLSVFVVFLTFHVLKFSAMTFAREATCGFEDHEHTPECFNTAGELICTRHVHTEACYQSAALTDGGRALELPRAEGAVTEEAPEDGEDPDGAREPSEPEYVVGDRGLILLSELLRELDMEADGIVSIGQVIEDDDTPIHVAFEAVGEDWEIRPLDPFDEIEIAIETRTDILLIRLLSCQWTGAAEEADPADPAAEEAPEGTEAALDAEAVEAPAEDGADSAVAADAGVPEDGAEEAGEVPGEKETQSEGEAPESAGTAEEVEAREEDAATETAEGSETAEKTDEGEAHDADKTDGADETEQPENQTAETGKADEKENEAAETVEADEEENETAVTGDADEKKDETANSGEADEKTDEEAESGEAHEKIDETAVTGEKEEETAETGEADEKADETAETGEKADEAARPGEAGSEAGEKEKEAAETGEADEKADEMADEKADDKTDEKADDTPDAGEAAGEDADAQAGERPTFVFEDGGSVLLSDILKRLSLEAGEAPEITLSDPEAVSVEALEDGTDSVVTARGYFDAVALKLTTDEGAAEILLSNPRPDNVMCAGDTLVSEDGRVSVVFPEEVVLPEDTALTAEEAEPKLDDAAAEELNAMLSGALGGRVGSLQWFDISLGDVHDVALAVTLRCNVSEGMRVAVAHLCEDGDIRIISDIEAGDGFITFETDGLSPFGVAVPRRALLKAAIVADGTGWDLDEEGVLTIHPDANMNYSSGNAAPWYAQRENVKSIVIEEGVTRIPNYFVGSNSSTPYYPNLTSVSIPNTVTSIGSYAFRYCTGLESVNIPDSVTSIGSGAFYYCGGLTDIAIPDGVTSIGDSAFYYCSGLQNVEIPDSVKTIGSYAFYYCSGLTDLVIPEGVTSIGNYAFRYCSGLTSVDLPASLTSVNTYAFADCTALTDIDMADANHTITFGTYAFRNTGLVSVELPEGMTTLPNYLFRNSSRLESVTLPSTLKTVSGTSAFYNCSSLREVIFDEHCLVTTLPGSFLSGKSKLERVVLPPNLTAVSNSMFSGCTSLSEVGISDMVTSIGDSAFYNCSSLTELEMPRYLKSIGTYAFYNSGLQSVELPATVETLGVNAFQNSKYLENVDLESTQITTLPSNAFRDCVRLKTVEFPEGLTEIGDNCFASCSRLVVDADNPGVLDIPDGVTKVGSTAFQGCGSLTSVNVPDSVTSLGAKAFLNCANLEEAVIGAGVSTINEGLFMNDSKLRRIEFKSEAITAIPKDAFSGCAALEEFDMPASVETIGANAFLNCKKLEEANFPAALTSIGASAYSGCTALKETTFENGDGPLDIGANAFANCTGLTGVDFPENLRTIGASAYTGCANLSDITFQDGGYDLTIESRAFTNLKKLTDVDFPKNLRAIGDSAFESSGVASFSIPAEGEPVSIGSRAFANTNLTSLAEDSLPGRVTEIGESAFLNCTKLREAKLPANLTNLSNGVFNGCSGLKDVELNDQLETIGSNAFNGCSSLTSVELPEKVASIGNNAFSGCSALKEVAFDDALQSIGSSAFSGCSSLTDVTLPDGVTSMGTGVFYNCPNLSGAKLPAGITELPAQTFSRCTRLTTPDFSDCQNLTAIGSEAFNDCQNLRALDLTPCEGLTDIGASAFKGCSHLTELSLPDSVTAISAEALSGCSALKELEIPSGTQTIGKGALNGCKGLENLRWDAANGSIEPFASGTRFTLTLGEHVDSLSDEALTALCDGGANMLVFEGENDLTLPDLGGRGFPRPLDDLGPGRYHADANGALYKIDDDGNATLVYVPDGLTSYTIPAQLTSDDGTPLPVTGVGANALYAAQTLTTLTVEDPESIATLASGAFANAKNLESVNGVTTRSGAAALFTNAEKGVLLFDRTRLTDDSLVPPYDPEALQYGIIKEEGKDPYLDPRDAANGWPDNIGIKIMQNGLTRRTAEGEPGYQKDAGEMPRDSQGTYLAFTGEGVSTSIELTNPASEDMGDSYADDKIRIFFKSDDGCFFTDDYEIGVEQLAEGTKPSGDEVVPSYVKFRVRETDMPGVRYFEFDRPENGATINLNIGSLFPNPDTRGGDMVVWAEYISAENVEATAGRATEPVEKHQTVNRTTIPDPFSVDKSATSTGALIPVAASDGAVYLPNHSYTITLDRDDDDPENPYLNNVGKDYVRSVDLVDELVLPPEILLNPVIIDEIRQNRLTYTVTYPSTTNPTKVTHNIVSPTYGNIMSFVESPVVQNYLTPVISLTEDEKSVRTTWRVNNDGYEAFLSGEEETFNEIREHKLTVTVRNRMLCLDPETAEANTEYTVSNKVDATLHYCYSPDQTSEDSAGYRVNSGDAKFTFNKTMETSGTIYRGEDRPFTLKLQSTGIMPVTLNEINRITDVLDTNNSSDTDAHYIDADGIWQMFTGETMAFGDRTLNDVLTITIQNAHLYGGEGSGALSGAQKTVITDDGGSGYVNQQYSGSDTAYSGRSSSDPNDLGGGTFTFSMDDDGRLQYTLSGPAGDAAGYVNSGEDIQAVFDRYGFFVTKQTRYTVDWDLTKLGEDFSLPSGETIELTIPARLKDAFMRLNADDLEREERNRNTSYRNSSNLAVVKKDNTTKDSSSSSFSHYRDAYLYKYVDGVAAAKQTYHYDDDAVADQTYYDAVEYTVNPRHNGTATYDAMPLTDHMTNRQVLMVPKTQNAGLSWAEGLETYTLDGVDYYLLKRTGTYEKVWTGDRWADHVEVTAGENGNYDTLIYWYLADYGGSYNQQIKYRAKVEINDPVKNGYIISGGNESWLGDHQSHRLHDYTAMGYGIYQTEAIVREWDKRIVKDVGDLLPGSLYCNITSGKPVVYRLRFVNDVRTDFTLTGADFYDVLPRATGFSWVKDENVRIEYVNFDVTGEDNWTIEKYTGNGFSDEYRIKWDDMRFSMTCNSSNGVGYVYVTLTFPGDTQWDTYVRAKRNAVLNNTLYVKNTSGLFDRQSVSHDLADTAVVRLEKGVYATGAIEGEQEIFRQNDNSRCTYENDDALKRKAYYYITLHNGGWTNLYLNPLQDVLPRGFTLVEKNAITLAYDEYNRPDTATVTRGDDGHNISYLTRNSVSLSYTTDEVNGRQRATITLTPTGQYNEYLGERKYYLAPGQVVVLRVECYTGEAEADTDDEATNIVAMPFFDYYGTGLDVADSESAPMAVPGGANPERNDGGCEIISDVSARNQGMDTAATDNTTQWLASDVTLTRGDIRPGLDKHLLKSVTNTGKVTYRPASVNPQDTLVWSVTATNSGDRAIKDYALTDVLPQPYNFVGEVQFRQKFGFGEGAASGLQTLFTIVRGTEGTGSDETAASTMELVSPSGDSRSLTIGEGPVALDWNGYTIYVRIDLDEEGCEVLSVRFPDKDMCIPSGGEVEMTLTSRYIMQILINKVCVNYAYVTPLAQTWTGGTNRGTRVDYTTPYADAPYNQSVSSNDQIITTFGGSTSSMKAIREKARPDNATDSASTPDYITVRDKTREITYTLSVLNSNLEYIRRLVLIDNLPEPGDHTVFNNRDKRNSAFRVLLSGDPNFRLWTVKNNGDRVELSAPEDYTIEWSSKTSFVSADWTGNASADWTAWDGPMDSTEDVHAIRLVFNDPTGTKFPAYGELFMEFDAAIDGDAEPGTIAYNGFGYNYTLKSNKRAEAAPRLVGVRVPDLPEVDKALIDARGRAFATEKDVTFNYVLYSGGALTFTEPLDRDGVIRTIEAAERGYVLADVEVPEGASRSAVSFSFNDQTGRFYQNGAYVDADWVMDDGARYTLMELPAEHYEAAATGGTAGRSHTFTFNAAADAMALHSVNRHDDWSFRMQKQDQYGLPVEGAVFAVYSRLEREYMSPEQYAALEGGKPAYELTGDYEGYKLMAIRTTDAAGNFQMDVLNGEAYVVVETGVPSALYTLNGEPQLVERGSGTGVTVVKAINRYSASGSSSFRVRKAMQGRPLRDGEFQFRIEPYDPIAGAVITDEAAMPPMPEVTEGIANGADGWLEFGPFEFDTDDIDQVYCYRVTEMIPAPEEREENVLYDETWGVARAQIINNGDGTLSAEWTLTRVNSRGEEVAWDGVFRNSYLSDTQISLSMFKTLTGKAWEDERFTFRLVSVGETADRVNATRVFQVSNDGETAFNLVYNQQDDGNTYEYDLYEKVPDNAVAYNAANGERLKVLIDNERVALHYATYEGWDEATRRAKLGDRQLLWKAAGIFYDSAPRHLVVSVNYDEDARGVRAEATLDGEPLETAGPIRFVNAFRPENIKAKVTVSKMIWWPERQKYRQFAIDESFTFRLIPDEAGQPMPETDTVTVTRGPVEAPFNTFTIPLSWEALGEVTELTTRTFYYSIVELTPGGEAAREGDRFNQLDYDATTRRVRIVMTGDPDDYSMTAVVEYENAEGEWNKKNETSFVNEYSTDPIGFPLTIEKQLNQKPAQQGAYSFTLYDAQTGAAIKRIAMDSPDGRTLTASITPQDLADFGGGLANQQTRAFYLLEDIPEAAIACGADGRPVSPETTYGDGSRRNDYTWKLNGVTYDPARINVSVTARLDEELTYRLIPTVTYGVNGQRATFRNTYEARGKAVVRLDKSITGRAFKPDEKFTFTLTPVNGAPLVTSAGKKTSLTATTDQDYHVLFDELTYTVADITDRNGRIEPRTFEYVLHEQAPAGAQTSTGENGETVYTFQGVTYAADRTITVQVSDNGVGALDVVVNGGQDISMVNVYQPQPTRLKLKARKHILDRNGNALAAWKVDGDDELDWSGKRFTFTLSPWVYADHASPMPGAEGGDTVEVDVEHQAGEFGEIEFTQPGTYEYYIVEELPDGLDSPYSTGESMAYDAVRHVATVVVRDVNEDGGELSAEVTYDGAAAEEVLITNRELKENASISVFKRWVKNDEVVDDGQSIDVEAITVHVYRLANGRGSVEMDFTDPEHPRPVQAGATAVPCQVLREADWKKTIDNLKNYEVDENGMFVTYSYYVREDKIDGWETAGYSIGMSPLGQASDTIAEDGNTITITNKMYSFVLPETGGPGTAPFTASGAALIALALALLLRRRKGRI